MRDLTSYAGAIAPGVGHKQMTEKVLIEWASAEAIFIKRKPKRTTMWVIFASPQQFKSLEKRYIDKKGSVTKVRSDIARFFTRGEAVDFAKERKIELTQIHYVGPEDFTEFEMQHGN